VLDELCYLAKKELFLTVAACQHVLFWFHCERENYIQCRQNSYLNIKWDVQVFRNVTLMVLHQSKLSRLKTWNGKINKLKNKHPKLPEDRKIECQKCHMRVTSDVQGQ
jgi:hypothetical protein